MKEKKTNNPSQELKMETYKLHNVTFLGEEREQMDKNYKQNLFREDLKGTYRARRI